MSAVRSDPVDPERIAPEVSPGVRLLPVVHERIELAAVVRAALDRLDPAGVAVELPTTLAEVAMRAARRLPRISLVISQEPEEVALVWVVAPGDPLVEALRWSMERNRACFCIDPDVPYEERHVDPVPDPYALWEMGAESYLELLVEQGGSVAESDLRREAGLAYNVRRSREGLTGELLLVLAGAAHCRRLAELLQGPLAQPLARVRRTNVDLRHLDPESLTGLLADSPLAHAVWESLRGGEPQVEVAVEETLSRRVSLVRHGLRLIAGQGGEDERRRRERLVHLACSAGVRRGICDTGAPDRRALGAVVWKVGSGSYREQTGESVQPWQRRMFFDFCRRCAVTQGQLVAGLYEWTVAARGVGDDNLAWEVFDAARTYPWQAEAAEIPGVRIDGSELDLGTRKIRFRRRFLRVKRRPREIPVRRRRSEDPIDWLRGFGSESICSFPPEDLVIEDWGRFLQRKAISILSAERTRTEPFVTGLKDGIDIRETLRNLHDDRVWVQERGRAPGEAGSVVVIFDRDRDERRFPFRMTWLGEHDQESDMAFYATDPLDQVVGPGITRCTYGGFMLSVPRGRLADVWRDPDYLLLRDKADVLVMAAVDYSQEKIVVHVAKDRPGNRLRRYAADQGKRLLHVPLASLSPLTRKKIRVLHLLSGREKRAVARDYIW